MIINKKLVVFILCIVCFWSCKKWDQHIRLNEGVPDHNLEELIENHDELSVFNKYLKKSNLVEMIQSSKNMTIWAPNNKALKNLPDSIVKDTSNLRKFILNHMSYGLHFSPFSDSSRIEMINGKYHFLYKQKFNNSTIEKSNIRASNGVLNIIDHFEIVRPNLWEYILKTRNKFKQNMYISTLNYTSQDPSQAQVDSINPSTGEPVYVPGTGILKLNSYLQKVYDLSNEDSLYTYIILTNTKFEHYKLKERPYFKSRIDSIANGNTSWNIVKDLAFKGLHSPDDLPNILVSKFNVHIPVNKANILSYKKVSNGIVYVMNEADWAMNEKIPVCIIQGENPVGFSSESESFMDNVFYRTRLNKNTGETFKDIYLSLGSSGEGDYIDYSSNSIFTTTYKIYWVALNDFTISGQNDDPYGTEDSLSQILEVGNFQDSLGNYSDSLFVPQFSKDTLIPPYYYKEMYIGEYTNDEYNWLLSNPSSSLHNGSLEFNPATKRLRIKSPAVIPSGAPHNLTVDYIKLVPVIK